MNSDLGYRTGGAFDRRDHYPRGGEAVTGNPISLGTEVLYHPATGRGEGVGAAWRRNLRRYKSGGSPEGSMAGAGVTVVLHSLCVVSVSAAFLLAGHFYDWSLITQPVDTLRLLLILHAPVVVAVFSHLRRDPRHCSFWKAVGRGLLVLPLGALLNSFGAIVLGAPVYIKYLTRTVYWSLVMSLFTFVPAACVFGSSKTDWYRILSYSNTWSYYWCMVWCLAYAT